MGTKASPLLADKRTWVVLVALLALFPVLATSCSWFRGKGESEPQTVGPDGGTFTF